MPPLKIVVTGPVCAGKTTFIRTLADGDVVTTEEQTTDATEKNTTTVGVEFGRVNVEGQSARLFGTPGQERFDYLWDIVAEGADGCVLLCPSDRPATFDRSLAFVQELAREEDVPVVVGRTRCDLALDEPTAIREQLALSDTQVVDLDARKRGDCAELLAGLVTTIGEQNE
jgi:small GTP-binding protein